MDQPSVHIVGAGLAGLAAAARLADSGRRVVLYEAARQAGGRCRSYFDTTLQMIIDNGNHLLLSGNAEALAFLKTIGGLKALWRADAAEFPFVDLATGERWRLRPNDGPLPWWIFSSARRVPNTRWPEYLRLTGLARPTRDDRRIDAALACEGVLYDRLWRPFLLAALNTDPPEASAALAGAVIRESLARGGGACRPIIAHGLSSAFVEPALAFLVARGGDLRLDHRLRRLDFDGARVAGLDFGDAQERLAPGDQLILATPAPIARELVPGLAAPDEFRAIVNAHFRLKPPPGLPPILGVAGGAVEWIFAFDDRISVTISCADRLLETGREELAALIWRDVAQACRLDRAPPPWQIIKEKRATFAATPAQNALRPGPSTAFANLTLAGDWTATGLPATIEGAVRSGHRAAARILAP